jgi:uncharacterized membrane protein YhaH (DUF805 family)
MFKNLRRLVLVHISLGILLIAAYSVRPPMRSHPVGLRDRAPFALSVIGLVLLAWAPFIVSGFYACDKLVERDPKATLAFIWSAIAIAIVAACLSLNVMGLHDRPSKVAVSLGVTIALIAAARLCSGIWKAEVSDPFRD